MVKTSKPNDVDRLFFRGASLCYGGRYSVNDGPEGALAALDQIFRVFNEDNYPDLQPRSSGPNHPIPPYPAPLCMLETFGFCIWGLCVIIRGGWGKFPMKK